MALDWLNGQPYSSHFGDVYFSSDSGLEETRHVFLHGNHLPQRFAELSNAASFCIAETGFGTGLNFLCAWQLFEQQAPASTSLDFFSVELFPLSDEELKAALALWPELHGYAEQLLACWQRRVPGWNRWHFAQGRIRLTVVLADVAEALPQLQRSSVDAWFLDGFSPARNPAMWGEVVMENIARTSRNGATIATFSSAGHVRRGLQQTGFEVEKIPGFGRKREMSRGRLVREEGSYPLAPSPSPSMGEGEGADFAVRVFSSSSSHTKRECGTPRTALVVGAGIAGCAVAYALAQRGIAVQLVERATQLASAASGNPRGILHARFGASDNAVHRLVLAAYGHALAWLDQVLPVDGMLRDECGLLQLACNEVETRRITRLSQQEWPAHLMQFVDAEQATQHAGVDMQFGGLWFPAGGWLVPPALCEKLASHTGITQLLAREVTTLEKTTSGWRVGGRNALDAEWQCEAEIVVVCCAQSAKNISQFANFPLSSVRGQISAVPQTQGSAAQRSVVCGDGYCAPSVAGWHVMGATHAFDDESLEIREQDHAENLAKLAAYAPALRQILSGEGDEQLSKEYGGLRGRAAIRCSAPGSMPLVGEVEQGLYCSLAHGTRGLLTAGLCAEVVAAQICGSLPPLPDYILAALAPLPRLRD